MSRNLELISVAQRNQKIGTMTNKCEYDAAVDNSDEDVFANFELLLEATKFDDANVSHDIELKINPKVWKKPLHVQVVNLELVTPDRQIVQKSIVLILQNVYAD